MKKTMIEETSIHQTTWLTRQSLQRQGGGGEDDSFPDPNKAVFLAMEYICQN
jgi:hypothetical protein